MLQRLRHDYTNYYNTLTTTYIDRIRPLEHTAQAEWNRFAENSLCLYVYDQTKKGMHGITYKEICAELAAACANGIPFVEYTMNTFLYQAWNGDNVSLLTGIYTIQPEDIHLPGAPCILTIFRKEGLTVVFTEQTTTTGLLRIQVS
jgi:hypothetical protein